MIRVISEPHHTMDDCILDGYARMIRACIAWAVAEAQRKNGPSQIAIEFLNDFIPNWREVYGSQCKETGRRAVNCQSRGVITNPNGAPKKADDDRAVELYKQNYSIKLIASALNISTRTVLRYLAKNGIQHRRTDNANRTVQLSES